MTEKKHATSDEKLFVVATPAATPFGDLRRGEVAVEGAKILKTHAHLFRPLLITYSA